MRPCRRGTFFNHHGGGCRPPQPPRYLLDFLPRIESSLFRSSCDRSFLDSLPLIFRSSWGGLPPPPTPPQFFRLFQSSWGGLPSSLFQSSGGCRHILGVLQELVCPYLNPHFYHEMREANLLVMLGMLAGHAGDVENDADDVDGLA